jgi:transcriptional regulator with XRE-family HTH domain
MTARTLLAWVLREARYLIDRSPEQVAGAVGLSARTVRRLEDANERRRPRPMTLRPLATLYGLNHGFLEQLVAWGDMEGSALRSALRERTFELIPESEVADLVDAPDELRLLAMRAARAAGPAAGTTVPPAGLAPEFARSVEATLRALPPSEHDSLIELVNLFGALDRRRRLTLISLVTDLQAARNRELGM